MITQNTNTLFYTPGPLPTTESLSDYLYTELVKIQSIINVLSDGHVEVSHAAPQNLTNGMIKLADGTNWNPGSGAGVYCYYNSAWHFLG